jgi:hypothetical protein
VIQCRVLLAATVPGFDCFMYCPLCCAVLWCMSQDYIVNRVVYNTVDVAKVRIVLGINANIRLLQYDQKASLFI